MKIIKYTLIGLILLLIAINTINILQNGGGPKGKRATEILGKEAKDASVNDIVKLSKADFKQLYHSAPCPAFTDLRGEYHAMNLPSGIMAGGVNFYTDNFFGPGKWEGKAFFPFEADKGWGYNIFMKSDNQNNISRTRKMNTYISKSAYDSLDSFHLDYSPYNSYLVHSMHDELRKINENLFIGYGSMAAGGGTLNPSPFIVYGPPKPWVGIQ
jgi:hypothetical protein